MLYINFTVNICERSLNYFNQLKINNLKYWHNNSIMFGTLITV